MSSSAAKISLTRGMKQKNKKRKEWAGNRNKNRWPKLAFLDMILHKVVGGKLKR